MTTRAATCMASGALQSSEPSWMTFSIGERVPDRWRIFLPSSPRLQRIGVTVEIIGF